MEAAIIKIVDQLTSAGPIGIIIAAVLVAGVVGLIIYGRTKQLFDNAAVDERVALFQKDVLEELRASRQRNEQQAQALERLQAQVFLYREQLRRLLDQLIYLKQGKITPDEIEIPEMK